MENALNQQMVETTDCLEAASVMKAMKNFWFWVLLICLLGLQTLFWLKQAALMEKPAQTNANRTSAAQQTRQSVVMLAATSAIEEQVEQVVQKAALPSEPAAQSEQQPTATPAPAPLPEEVGQPEPTLLEKLKQQELEFFRIDPQVGRLLTALFNFGALTAALMYCLCLLMNLKISLTGRLGGINHICRAFFWSLFLLALMVPWQTFLQGVMVGIIYLPEELFGGCWVKENPTAFWKTLYYLRFCGLWLVGLWLLVAAQSRSVKWAKAVLRRLGMAR